MVKSSLKLAFIVLFLVIGSCLVAEVEGLFYMPSCKTVKDVGILLNESVLCLCGIHGFCSPRLALASPPPLAPTKRVPHNSNDLRVIGSTHGGRALWVLAGEDSPGQAWGNRTRGSHRDKALRGQAPKRTILSSTPGYQSQGCYKKRVWVLKEGPGLAPVRIPLTTYCPLWQWKLPQGFVPVGLPFLGIHGFCSPRLTLASPPPLAPSKDFPTRRVPHNSNDLRVIGSTHGGRALWVLAGEDSPGQARTRGSHRDKALRGQAPKRTILSSTPGYQSQGCYKKRVWVLKEGPGLAPVRIPLTTYCPLWQWKLPQGFVPVGLPFLGIHGFCSPRLTLASPPPLAPSKDFPTRRVPHGHRFYTWGTRFVGASGGGLARASLGEQNPWIPQRQSLEGASPKEDNIE
uniref:Uncharacterized protein n=1 Tax=Fagus sylvatica TaxID=28930 RepID=A0A2N9G3P3_FAGSY